MERDPRGWSVTQVYFALVAVPQGDQVHAGKSESAWIPVDEAMRKRLVFDHTELLGAAIARLHGKVEYTSMPAFSLDEPFSLPELQRVYEVVLRRPLDKSAFRKRMLDGDFVAEPGRIGGGAGRAAMGYRIKDRAVATVFPRTFRSGE